MIEIQTSDQIARLSMSHGKVNAIDVEFCRCLTDAFSKLEREACRAVILTGNSTVFSAGIDLKRLLREDAQYIAPFLEALENLFQVIFTFPKPVIALINGPAIAGGCMMASACDHRIIAPTARIGLPESRVGVPLPMLAIEIARFVATPAAFQQMIQIGALYQGAGAVAVGLADQVGEIDELESAATLVATELARIPPATFRLTKRQARSHVLRLAEQNRQEFLAEFISIWLSADTRAAIQTYVDERLS